MSVIRPGVETVVFDLPSLRMHALTAGPTNGPLVLLLHGFPETAYSWRHQMPALAAAGYRVVAPDQRGYDLTDKHGPYDTPTLVNDIVALIDACDRDDAYVAGHDWGGIVAWRLAEAHPGRVRRLAILNVPRPQVHARLLSRLHLGQLVRSTYVYFFQLPYLPEAVLRANDYRVLRQSLLTTSLPHTFTEADIQVYREAWAQPGALSAMLGWYRAEARRAAAHLGREATPRLATPTLILWGERDVALDVAGAERSLATLDDGRLVRFPDATHWVHEDFPTQVNGQLLKHFAARQGLTQGLKLTR